MKNRYRVISYFGTIFRPQVRFWWWPFWIRIDAGMFGCDTLQEARDICIAHSRNYVVEEVSL
jgi:hypothetical protein